MRPEGGTPRKRPRAQAKSNESGEGISEMQLASSSNQKRGPRERREAIRGAGGKYSSARSLAKTLRREEKNYPSLQPTSEGGRKRQEGERDGKKAKTPLWGLFLET